MTNTTQVESITNEEAMVEEIINRKLAQIQHETNKRIQRIESLLQDREYSPAVFARPVMMDVSTRTDICRRIEMSTVESKAPKSTKPNLEWQPPKQIHNRYEIKIRKEEASSAETLAAIRGKLTRKELAGDGLKHVRVHRHGLVSLISKDQIEKISSVRGIKIDKTEKRPKFRITGVSREITEEQMIEDLADQNEEIMNIIQEERKKTGNNEEFIKVVNKYICKNPERNNVTIETIPSIHRAALKKGKVVVGYLRQFVDDFNEILQCYKCSRFGHKQIHCRSAQCCYICAGPHGIRDCKSSTTKCANCKRAGPEVNTNHRANDRIRPVYKKGKGHRRNETEMALKILQINIEKCIQASTHMRAKADKEKYDIILVQEPATRTKAWTGWSMNKIGTNARSEIVFRL
ncbi:hypothetical protein GWI33_020200 [Rhynchophorus ferrugineus]|uniref:CCHC-type domain-containing protein n=1 Tax=Rhynchophorus ferrugineus TaxID=354439 RepID=A0A834HSV4_RHYFE|nr:hypothetical protein GWI33_020200 [Rhynchophorus ferrugineus]